MFSQKIKLIMNFTILYDYRFKFMSIVWENSAYW